MPNTRKQYERLKTLTLEEGFELIKTLKKRVEIDGRIVTVSSFRLQSFLKNGIKCANKWCNVEGSYFAIERARVNNSINKELNWHLNLWGICPTTNQHILFTMDHIIPKCYGGFHELENTQTMCGPHNWNKGTKEGRSLERYKKKNAINSNVPKFVYTGKKNVPILRHFGKIVRKTFNLFLNDPPTWEVEDLLKIIWKHAGLKCTEVRLVNNTYVRPEIDKLGHRYDLFFLVGEGIQNNKDVNLLMMEMEKEIRSSLNVTLLDTHFVKEKENYANNESL